MNRGEIRWYTIPRSNKRRPVLILTRDSAIPYLGEVTIAPLTTTIRDIPTEVVLDRGDGLLRESAINLDHVQTISKGRIGDLITTLDARRMDAVRDALLFAMGFPGS